MKNVFTLSTIKLPGAIIALIVFFVMANAGNALAHCDTLDGPVVADARQALQTGDVSPVLKWVSKDQEGAIKAVYKHTLAVRQLGDEAKTLADAYFFETLVRIHRAGEGAPYTGLKPSSSIDPAVALADKAIENGSVDQLANVLTTALKNGLTTRFDKVIDAGKQADKSVELGREYVEAYVEFTHFAEGIHGMIKGAGDHSEH
ncbi:DUF6448 family protein [Desulfocastanea catecholica]